MRIGRRATARNDYLEMHFVTRKRTAKNLRYIKKSLGENKYSVDEKVGQKTQKLCPSRRLSYSQPITHMIAASTKGPGYRSAIPDDLQIVALSSRPICMGPSNSSSSGRLARPLPIVHTVHFWRLLCLNAEGRCP